MLRFKVDIALAREGELMLQGWAFGSNPEEEVKFTVVDQAGNPVPGTTVSSVRRDEVVSAIFGDYVKSHGALQRELGFDVHTPYAQGETRILVLQLGGQTKRVKFTDHILEEFNSVAHRKREKLLALFHWETVEVAWEYFQKHGLRALFKKSVHKIQNIQDDYDYNEWYKKVRITDEELAKQRESAGDFAQQPTFSIVIPVYATPEKFLRRMLDSIREQTYPKFEVCLVDATPYAKIQHDPTQGRTPQEVLAEYAAADSRFRYETLTENLGIAENTNAAIRMATGDFIVLADHDDELEPQALYECVRAINAHPDVQVLYSDEDKVDFEDIYYFEPHFKTDFNPDLLRSVNYICHLFVARRSLLDAIAETDADGRKIYERSAYDGAQDYDLILRATEKAQAMERARLVSCANASDANAVTSAQQSDAAQASDVAADTSTSTGDGADVGGRTAAAVAGTEPKESAQPAIAAALNPLDQELLRQGRFTSSNIIHIPMVLYHWRAHQASTAQHPEAKLYAFEAGARAVYDHCKRIGLPIRKVEQGITYGFYHPIYENQQPLISVVIPNKDHTADLDKAISSLAAGNYKNLEFIIVENNSDQAETWNYYEALKKRFPEELPADFIDPATAVVAPFAAFTAPASTSDSATETASASFDPTAELNSAASLPAQVSAYHSAAASVLPQPVVKVVKWDGPFNYSAINNYGVQFTHGQYLLFLNNDIEEIDPDSIDEMIGYVQRDDVGICGARLLYPDEDIQHAGVIMGMGGIAGAAFVRTHDSDLSYMHRAKCIQDYSCVTAACLLTKRSLFDAVGGFTEKLAVAFNDVDYCMKVRALGKLVVYNPYAKFYHYESKSRGMEDTPEKLARFHSEILTFGTTWKDILRDGDPYYSPALTFRKANFALKDLTQEQVGEPMHYALLKGIVWDGPDAGTQS